MSIPKFQMPQKWFSFLTFKKSGLKVVSSFFTVVLLMSGYLISSDKPAFAAGESITVNNPNIVMPGQTNAEALEVTLTGLGNISGAAVVFSGVTLVPNFTNWKAITVRNASWTTCPDAQYQIAAFSASTTLSSGSCSTATGKAQWDNGGVAVNVGGSFSFRFPAGSLLFAASGPYSVAGNLGFGSFGVTSMGMPLSPQSALSVTSTSTIFNTPLTLTTSGGSGTGAVTFQVTNGASTTGCSVNGGVLTSSSAGTCLVTATKAADSIYSAIYSVQTAVTVEKASRTISFSGATTYLLAYGATQTVTATPSAGSGDGTVSYSASGTGCTVDPSTGVIRVTTYTASCTVSASISAGTNYLAATTTTQVIVNGTVKAITVSASAASVSYGTNYSTNALATGQLVGLDEISSGTFTYTGTNGTTYGPSSVKPTNAGTYSAVPTSVTFSTGSASNYNITFASGFVVISKAARALNFTTTPSAAVQYGNSTTLVAVATLGPNDGVVTYSVTGDSDACSVDASSGTVTVTKASGTCKVEASITSGTNYLAATATAFQVTVAQRAISISGTSSSVTVGNAVSPSFSVSTGGLVGSDSISGVTYNFAGTGSTTYASSATAPTAIGSYKVTPSTAVFSSGSLSNYSITYTSGNFSINAKLSRTISFSSTSTSMEYGDTLTVVATPSAGSNDGILSYSVGSSTACEIDSTTGFLTITAGTGTCEVTASISEGSSYLSATTSTPKTVTVSPRSITISVTAEDAQQGNTLSPQFEVTTGTLVGSDDISGMTYSFEGTANTTYASSTTQPRSAGTYKVTGSNPVFSVGNAGNYNVTFVDDEVTISAPAVAVLDLSMNATVGMYVAGSGVEFTAEGLQNSAPFTVILRSTPQTLSQGVATNGYVSSSATIPGGLSAGWHSLTFTSTAANGTVVKEVMYFKVSDSGMLLSKTTDTPAELAYTGTSHVEGMSLTALMLLSLGLVLLRIRRRARS